MRMYCRNRYAVISISSPGIPHPRGFAGAQPRVISRNRSAVGSRLLHEHSAVGSRLLHDRSAVGSRLLHDRSAVGSRLLHDRSAVGSRLLHDRSAVGSRLLHDRSAVGSRLLHDRSAVGLRYFLVGFNLSFNNPGNSRVSLATGTPTDSNALILPSAEPEPPEMMAPA
jgi:hypothetical protein